MSTLRKEYEVSWNGEPSVKVRTSARDMAVAQEYVDNPAMGVFAMLHGALVRTGHTVPELDEWIDQLDEINALDGGDEETDPTE